MENGDENTSELRKVFLRFSSGLLEDSMSKGSNEIYEFGPFRLNVSEHLFERVDGNSNGSLPEKAFQTLTVLVRNHGNLVTKDELLKAVWPDTIVEENNLDKAIHAVRHALGEKPGEQRYIETVRKHGYRFIAEVSRPDPTENGRRSRYGNTPQTAEIDHTAFEEPVSKAAQPETENAPAHNRTTFIVLSVLVVGVLMSGFYWIRFPGTSDVKRSIAVLPFRPINALNNNDGIELGLTETLILKLQRMKGFVVRPLGVVRKYSETDQDPASIGKTESVDFVLVSNYQMADGKIRVTSQLINVSNGQIEGSYQSSNSVSNVFELQDAVAAEIGNGLLAHFRAEETGAETSRGTTNEEAYGLFIQGKSLSDQPNSQARTKAIEYFEAAIAKDPNFAAAYAGLAHALIVNSGRTNRSGPDLIPELEGLVNKAIELDDQLAEAYAVRGRYKFDYERDHPAAEAAFQRAIALDPHSEWGHSGYAEYLAAFGRFDEALSEIKLAFELNPRSCTTQVTYGRIYYLARRYDEAIVQYERVIEVDRTFANAYGQLWITNEMKGDYDKAFEWWLRLMIQNQDPDLEKYRAIYQTSGWQGLWRYGWEQRKGQRRHSNDMMYAAARDAVRLGETELAFEYLSRAIDHRQAQVNWLKYDPFFDTLRSDPRFDELLRRVGF